MASAGGPVEKARIGARAMKKILLCNALVSICTGGHAAGIEAVQHAPHPYIDRHAFNAAAAIEQRACGHLDANACDACEHGLRFVERERAERPEVDLAGDDAARSVDKIARAKAGAQRRERVRRERGDGFGRWEGVPAAAERPAEGGAHAFDNTGDAGDVIVLADDKGTQRLPGLLAQHTDAGGLRDGFGQRGVGAKAILERAVVAVEIEITAPNRVKIPRALTGDDNFSVRLCNLTYFFKGGADKGVLIQLPPAKSLPA